MHLKLIPEILLYSKLMTLEKYTDMKDPWKITDSFYYYYYYSPARSLLKIISTDNQQ